MFKNALNLYTIGFIHTIEKPLLNYDLISSILLLLGSQTNRYFLKPVIQ